MIFVTGGTGLIGSHLLYELLLKGETVRALKRPKSNIDQVKKVFSYYTEKADELFSKIIWVEGDVLDIPSLELAMENCEQVYHCAALVSFDKKEMALMKKINVEGTANMVNVAAHLGIKKFCFVSSVAAIGRKKHSTEVFEHLKWDNDPKSSAYSLSKQNAEREVWRATAEGLNSIIVNPSIVIGPGEWDKSSTRMIDQSWKGINWYTEGITGFVDVRDVVNVMIKLMESEIKNERFIISAEDLSFKKFFELSHQELGKKAPTKKAGKYLLEAIWRIEKLKSKLFGSNPKITRESARAAYQEWYFSNEKIKSQLHIEFIPVAQSIKDTCRIYLEDRGLK